MGKQATARDLRRETKRTLGHSLKAYADNQLARLEQVERRTSQLREVMARGFFGRLTWLVTGK